MLSRKIIMTMGMDSHGKIKCKTSLADAPFAVMDAEAAGRIGLESLGQ